MENSLLLKLNCPDQVGLIAKLTGFVAELGGNLLEVHQFTDQPQRWFFTRIEIDASSLSVDTDDFNQRFAQLVDGWQAQWSLRKSNQHLRTVILVSRYSHCLADLLYRWHNNELPMQIPAVISNHHELGPMVEREGIPFMHIPIPAGSREPGFRTLAAACRELQAEVIVMARYMQILPHWFCAEYAGRIINIHHSFLPAFAGANPYRKAYERGVKLIGATCHYATSELDEGPIIDQEVVRVEHYHQPDDLLRLGRDCERLALARGLRFHLTDRTLLHGRRTIVFRD